MFNDNVGEMPIDIFGDYVSDCLGEEWIWEYFTVNFNSLGNSGNWANGVGYGYDGYVIGNGYYYGFHYHGFHYNENFNRLFALGFGRCCENNGDGYDIGEFGSGIDRYGFERFH